MKLPSFLNRPERLPRGPLLVLAGLGGLMVVVVGMLYGQFEYHQLCWVCGRASTCVDWQIPVTRHTYYTFREERETSLSRALARHRLVEPHEHEWWFVSGRGNGTYLLLGEGHPISWSLLGGNSGTFVDAMLRWTDRETTELWLNRMRDPNFSRMCLAMANASLGETFTSRAHWEQWLEDYQRDHVQMMAGPLEQP
jgi:hypothetical protein